MDQQNQIILKNNFSEQYTIDIETDMKAVSIHIISKVRLRYNFTILKIEKENVEIRLIQLENKVLESNNNMINEIAVISQVFGKMYSELHLKLSHKGKVVEILNFDLIVAKWNETKAEMQKAMVANDGIKEAISLNDAIYTNFEKVKIAIEANEFLKMYFGEIFGIELPVYHKEIAGTNFFNTANLQWGMAIETITIVYEEIEYRDVTMSAIPRNALTAGFYNAAYNQFADKIDITKLNTELKQLEKRKVELKTGKIVEALIVKTEIADAENLYTKTKYTMRSDSYSTKTSN